MKIRTGFVSNSSSSSFMLLGSRLEYDDLTKVCSDALKDEDEIFINDDVVDKFMQTMDTKFQFVFNEELELCVMGYDPNMLPHDKTLEEIYKDAVSEFHRLGFESIENVSFISEVIESY